MASSVARRFLRRVRTGGRHSSRALRRNRAATAFVAVVGAVALATAAVTTGDVAGGGARPAVTSGHVRPMPDDHDPMGWHQKGSGDHDRW